MGGYLHKQNGGDKGNTSRPGCSWKEMFLSPFFLFCRPPELPWFLLFLRPVPPSISHQFCNLYPLPLNHCFISQTDYMSAIIFHALDKYFLSIYSMLGAILGPADSSVNKHTNPVLSRNTHSSKYRPFPVKCICGVCKYISSFKAAR